MEVWSSIIFDVLERRFVTHAVVVWRVFRETNGDFKVDHPNSRFSGRNLSEKGRFWDPFDDKIVVEGILE